MLIPVTLLGNVIKTGGDFTEASRTMFATGYKENVLEMISLNKDERLMFWSLKEGTLVVVYSQETNKIVGISYYWCDEREKAIRETVEIDVKSFDVDSGNLILQMKRPEKAA